ncbi:hypothetical protein PG985_007822 [Apiospora marii]|uniref:G domain-containing protein n=1 Tax=Apiospora marii TaxID=335849 RepID=A0ABR1SQ11_9PEZI
MPLTPECGVLGSISQLRLRRFFPPPTVFTTQVALSQHSQIKPDHLVPRHQSGPLPQLHDAACRNVVVAVVGPVGCGKSTLINHLVNEDVVVGYNDGPCTRDITAYRFMYDQSTQVHLIDSPGFNGATITNAMVLEKIAAFLKHSQSLSMTLDGVVSLHRYSDRGALGSKLLSVERVRDLVETLADGNGVFAVVTWHDLAQRGGSGQERKQKVGQVVRDGYGVVRVRNTERSAMELMTSFLVRSNGFPMTPLANHPQPSLPMSTPEPALAEVQPPPSLAPPETTASLFIFGVELVNTVRPIRENFLTARRLAPELFRKLAPL